MFAAVVAGSAVVSTKRIALVTGANKGIGKEVARLLGALPNHAVVLGCRDEQLGMAAAAELQAEGCDAAYCWVDLADPSSFESARAFVEREYGRLDALVNNAAVCYNDPTLYGKVAHTPFEQQAAITVQTNYHGALGLTRALLPLLRASSASPRLVNVASSAGRLRGSAEIQSQLTSPDLDVPQLSALMEAFVRDAEGGRHLEAGWPDTCYGVSKMGVIALTRVLAREEPTILVNSADPGYCATDQNADQGYISAAQGAATPAMLAHAQLPQEAATSHHWYESRSVAIHARYQYLAGQG